MGAKNSENNQKVNSNNKKNIEKKVDRNLFKNIKDTVENAQGVVLDTAKTAVDMAGKGLDEARKTLKNVSDSMSENQRIRNLEKYKPIFKDSIPAAYPKMIYIVDNDKRMTIKECENAIGFEDNKNGVELLGIYHKDVNKFDGIEYYPDKKPTSSVYYVHPLNNKLYIELTEYFSYLKEQRITELEQIAQDLGAKHFKVEIMEETLSSIAQQTKANTKLGVGKDKAGVSIEKEDSKKAYESIGIASELTWPGRDPIEPKLKLWANNESIKNLIKQRLSADNRLQSKTFRLDYNTSSGIKEREAAKIDGALKILKFEAAGKIQREAKNESRRRLEYTIDF